MTISTPKTWTDEELLAFPKDGCKREIVGGELVTMSPAGFNHGSLITRLVTALGQVVFAQDLGEIPDGQTGYRLNSGDLFSPDISFVTKDRVAARRARKKNSEFFQGAPDFFVEVLSPSDTVQVLQEKLDQFFAEGTRLAWIINPKKRLVHVYRSPSSFTILQSTDILSGEDVIPGFALPVSKLFVE